MRLDVRCCCQPKKLLGTIEVSDPRPGRVVFKLFAPLAMPWTRITQVDQAQPNMISHVELPIAYIRIGSEKCLAVKAEGAPLDILRRIPTFKETV